MFYAFHIDDNVTVVAASNYIKELNEWFATLKGEHYIDAREPDFMERLSDPVFERFSGPLFIFQHTDADQRKLFEEAHQLLVGTIARAVDRHNDMVGRDAPDPYDPNDTRTIAEIEGLSDDTDKWDERTEEEKAADAETKKMMDELRKKGEATEDSFTPVQNKGVKAGEDRMRITDVRSKRNADGSVDLDNILASKELHVDAEPNATLTVEVNGQKLDVEVQWKGTTLYGSDTVIQDVWVDKLYGDPTTYTAVVVSHDKTQNSMVVFNPLITNIHSIMEYRDPEETAAETTRKEEARAMNSDHVFVVGKYNSVVDGVVVTIVRKDFFAEHKTINPQGILDGAAIPKGYSQDFASIFTAKEVIDPKEVVATLLDWGFEQDPEFDAAMADWAEASNK